jgi:hypothetical protein
MTVTSDELESVEGTLVMGHDNDKVAGNPQL